MDTHGEREVALSTYQRICAYLHDVPLQDQEETGGQKSATEHKPLGRVQATVSDVGQKQGNVTHRGRDNVRRKDTNKAYPIGQEGN